MLWLDMRQMGVVRAFCYDHYCFALACCAVLRVLASRGGGERGGKDEFIEEKRGP